MKKLLLITLAAMIVVPSAQSKTARLKWMAPPMLPPGAMMAVVKGDPGKAGPFTIRVRMPANYAVPPHHHPSDEVVRIVSGGPLHYGMGTTVMANAGTLEKGYHLTMQGGMNHWVHAPAATVVQVDGTGPFQIIYANPADDPRKK